MENDNLVHFPRTNAAVAAAREVFAPGALSAIEDIRNVPMSQTEIEALENLGLRLGEIDARPAALLCLGLAARWKAAA